MPADTIAKSDYSLIEHARQVIAARDHHHTHYKDKPNGLSPLTLEEQVTRAATYEWHCTDCGKSTYMPSEGGNLEWDCECDHIDGHNLEIYIIFSGKRRFWSTSAAVEGRAPGTPSKARLHLEACDDPACEDLAHRWRSPR